MRNIENGKRERNERARYRLAGGACNYLPENQGSAEFVGCFI